MSDGWNTHFTKVVKSISSYNVYQLSFILFITIFASPSRKPNTAQCLPSILHPAISLLFIFFLLLCRLDETYFHASIYYLNQFVLVLSFFHFLFFLTFCLLLTVFSLLSCYCPLLFREPDLDQYSALIMDEAHERLPFFLSFLLSIDIYI